MKQEREINEKAFIYNLDKVLEEIREMLIEKNRKYGNSAVEPIRIFSKADNIEQIKVRIDDKLSRLRHQTPEEDEDVIKDLLGYLILYKVTEKINK